MSKLVIGILLLFVLLSSCTGKAGLPPPQFNPSIPARLVQANSCDADNLCEINSAKIQGDISVAKWSYFNKVDAKLVGVTSWLSAQGFDAGEMLQGNVQTPLLYVTPRTSVNSRVGIGTQTPQERLHVDGGNILLKGGALTILPRSGSNGIRIEASASGGGSPLVEVANLADVPSIVVYNQAGINPFVVDAHGKVGVNNLNPQAELDVQGSAVIHGQIRFPSHSFANAPSINPNTVPNSAFACFDGNGQLFRSDTPCK